MGYMALLTDLQGAVHGELTQASSRRLVLPHQRLPMFTTALPLWHPLAETALETDCLIKFYKKGVTAPLFVGPVITAQETASEGQHQVAITASGPLWRLSKRMIPGSLTVPGMSYTGDLGTIAQTILAETNATSFTGIDVGTWAATVGGSVGPWHQKPSAEAMAELAAAFGSFEWRVRPTEPTSGAFIHNWPRIGYFDVAPEFGVERPDVIFEYGTSAGNVASYERIVSRDTLLTRAVISVSGWPDSPPAGSGLIFSTGSDQSNSVMLARGLFEEMVNDAGVVDNAIRTSIADFHADIRRHPKQVIVFQPITNARPEPFVDYNVGDYIRGRAIVEGRLRFDAVFRIWGITVDVDENGNENAELELVMP